MVSNCTSHDNKSDGVIAYDGAVVDLMGEGTSVHDNEGHGLSAFDRGTINVYQPCVLNDMSHGNKLKNINMEDGPWIIPKPTWPSLNLRSPSAGRERWCNQLDPTINKAPFTKEEDALLNKLQGELGNKWSQIALLTITKVMV